jgi:hypothetical protein
MADHERFEELSALAAIGQLPEAEVAEIQDHFDHCESCRSLYADFARILRCELPSIGDRRDLASESRTLMGGSNGGYRQRFIARARAARIRFSPEVDQKPLSSKVSIFAPLPARTALWVLASLLIVIGAWTFRYKVPGRTPVTSEPEWQRQAGQLATLNLGLRSRIAEMAQSQAAQTAELEQANRDQAASREQLAATERLLERAQESEQALHQQLGSEKAQVADFERRDRESARVLDEMKAELDQARSRLAETEAASAEEKNRSRELSEKLAAQAVLLGRQRQLLAVGKEIRDLMGARNLHIIDVFDVDGGGKRKRAFGRAFYTEGKSLIFYAFDLVPNQPSKNEHSFQAWGYHEPYRHPVQNLGIFYVDDKSQNRWVLKFNDPEVLAQIDAVFVTVEPPGGSSIPRGSKLLYAYLGGQPNHP